MGIGKIILYIITFGWFAWMTTASTVVSSNPNQNFYNYSNAGMGYNYSFDMGGR